MAIAAWWVLPHADLPGYGKFADDALDPTHARNVFSNFGFLLVGAAGVRWARRHRDESALALFAGIIATAFGSAYFHRSPLIDGELNRFTLLWDRLPMTIAFGGFLALMFEDRVFARPNRIALPLFIGFGFASALFWFFSGNLVPYGFFQLYVAAGTLLMMALLPPKFTESGYVVASVVLFGVAKIFEDLDHQVFAKWSIGGHPLKHITATIAAWMILLWLQKRRTVSA